MSAVPDVMAVLGDELRRLDARRRAVEQLGYQDVVFEAAIVEQLEFIRDLQRAYLAELRREWRLPRGALEVGIASRARRSRGRRRRRTQPRAPRSRRPPRGPAGPVMSTQLNRELQGVYSLLLDARDKLSDDSYCAFVAILLMRITSEAERLGFGEALRARRDTP